MKSNIKLRYRDLGDTYSKLNNYLTALQTIKEEMNWFQEYLGEENSGLAVDAILERGEYIDIGISIVINEVEDLYNIFVNYTRDMYYLIKPLDGELLTQVNKTDIWWNLKSITSIKSNIDKLAIKKEQLFSPQTASEILGCFASEEEKSNLDVKISYNYNSMESYREKFISVFSYIQDEYDTMDSIYTNNICNYETTDDYYATEAKNLYDTYSTPQEKTDMFLNKSDKVIEDFLYGVVMALWGLLKGLWDLLYGSGKYLVAGIVVGVTEDNTPEWATEYIDSVNKQIYAIADDPMLIIEGLCQSSSDTISEKGIAYGLGYTGADIIIEIVGTKGVGKITKGLKAAENLDDVADVGKYADDIFKGGNGSAYHLVGGDNAGKKIQSVLDGIDINYTSPDSRFGQGFYVAGDGKTSVAELAYHGTDASYAIRYDMNLEGQKVLDLTDSLVANKWGYVQGESSLLECHNIADKALDEGFTVIKVQSYRCDGINYVIYDNFDEILSPQMVIPVHD